MSYLARTLITRAYYLSQIVAREYQVVSDSQITDGLYLLNALIDLKNSDTRLIPYYTPYTFNTIQGQEMYSIPGLLEVDSLTFNIGPVRYSMLEESRTQYFANYRIDNVQSLPYQYRVERTLDGADIYMYFTPSQVFVMKLWGKFQLDEVTLDQDMALTYDQFYIEYLLRALANYICQEYGQTLPDSTRFELQRIEKKLMDVSPTDLALQTKNYFGNSPGLNWGVINLSGGWLPYG